MIDTSTSIRDRLDLIKDKIHQLIEVNTSIPCLLLDIEKSNKRHLRVRDPIKTFGSAGTTQSEGGVHYDSV